jgi:hypothetical protein
MGKSVQPQEVKLARNWSKSRVLDCLSSKQKAELVRFINERYSERFFDPIRCLGSAVGNNQGYGFAIMALCCLLIETLQCYRRGLPSSHNGELKCLSKLPSNKGEYSLADPLKETSQNVFIEFFQHEDHQKYFTNIDGKVFYREIRCGLLHQAQTKGGWRLLRTGKFWDTDQMSINRDEFSQRLRECFDGYLKLLQESEWDEEIWKSARKKLWWLAETS